MASRAPVRRPTRAVTFVRARIPHAAQVRHATRLRMMEAIYGDELRRKELNGAPATTMRQGMTLIGLTALVAGFLPFLLNWLSAGRVGAPLPLYAWARTLENTRNDPLDVVSALIETSATMAGLTPIMPGWLSAGFSSLGNWLSQPFTWTAFWIVYGLGVLIFAKLFGATTTLQRFYAGTSYAVLPLLATALTPIPWIGPLIGLAAFVVAFVAYVRAVQALTHLSLAKSLLSVMAPAVAISLLFTVSLIVASFSVLRLLIP